MFKLHFENLKFGKEKCHFITGFETRCVTYDISPTCKVSVDIQTVSEQITLQKSQPKKSLTMSREVYQDLVQRIDHESHVKIGAMNIKRVGNEFVHWKGKDKRKITFRFTMEEMENFKQIIKDFVAMDQYVEDKKASPFVCRFNDDGETTFVNKVDFVTHIKAIIALYNLRVHHQLNIFKLVKPAHVIYEGDVFERYLKGLMQNVSEYEDKLKHTVGECLDTGDDFEIPCIQLFYILQYHLGYDFQFHMKQTWFRWEYNVFDDENKEEDVNDNAFSLLLAYIDMWLSGYDVQSSNLMCHMLRACNCMINTARWEFSYSYEVKDWIERSDIDYKYVRKPWE